MRRVCGGGVGEHSDSSHFVECKDRRVSSSWPWYSCSWFSRLPRDSGDALSLVLLKAN